MKIQSDVQKKVYGILCDQLGIPQGRIGLSDSLSSLGADELDEIEIAMCIEEELGVHISDSELKKIDTVGSLIERVKKEVHNGKEEAVSGK